ncbi:hypothetical protein SAMN05444143_11622 [Flavobacterium succinicans]|uniref:Uncharacterized protein n=1 Tax=Flavobacterium succinicans TaxID=29536 RepID=A0A1I4ZM02_9FLAO|nr:hypothetical protein [Flavobacterium succinicans]SFN51197.1 hypothetical protein SAMN05444143_11622 [Flavobacterium succinicans]
MKTLIPLVLLLLLLSSYKSYTILEYKNQNKLTGTEIKEFKSFEIPLNKEMYLKNYTICTKLSRSFSVEIDGTFVGIKGLYKLTDLQLLSKKEPLLFYNESTEHPFSIKKGKVLAQLN